LDLINCAIDAVAGVSFFLFLENYFLKYGFMRGYYLGFRGEISPSRSTQSVSRSKRKVTDKTATTMSMAAAPNSTASTAFTTLNAASSVDSTATGGASSDGVKETVSRITHASYETSQDADNTSTSNSSSSSSTPNIKSNPEPEKAPIETPPANEPKDESKEDETLSGSQSSYIVKLFKSDQKGDSLWT
jgi:hypothetical protein